MPIQEYLLSNFAMIFELIGLLLILFISAHISQKLKIYTRIAVGLLFFSILVAMLEGWTQTFDHLTLWRPILTAFKYSTYPLILVVLIMLISQLIKPLSKKWIPILLIPEIITVPFYFSSQWTGLVFRYSETNHWSAGPLRYMPYVVFIIYLIVFVVLNIIYLKYYSAKNRFIAIYITLVSMAMVIFYLIIGRTDDYNPIFTASLVFYFLFIYIHMANIDSLTGLLNRQSYYQALNDEKNKISYVVSVDMNNLKEINDNYGHAAGDEALIVITEVLKAHVGNNGTVYRVGGDEFMILFIGVNEEDVVTRIEKMKDELSKTRFTCAFGYAKNDSRITIDEAIKESDKQMYLDKARTKRKKK